MLAAGFAIAARSWWIVAIMLLMFAAIYVPVIAGEERYLRQKFPDYDDYARHVPRLLPRLTPYGSQQARTLPRATGSTANIRPAWAARPCWPSSSLSCRKLMW